MGPKPINLTSKSTSVWILLMQLYGTNAFTNSWTSPLLYLVVYKAISGKFVIL